MIWDNFSAHKMAGLLTLKIGALICICIFGIIAVFSMVVMHQNLNRVERMVTSQELDNGMKTGDNAGVHFIRYERSASTGEERHARKSENENKIEFLEYTVKKLQTEYMKLARTVSSHSKHVRQRFLHMRAKRAVDDQDLGDRDGNQTDDIDHSSHPHGIGGAVYIRWGRTTCPEQDAELLYEGVTAGSNYDQTGSAANTLCLPYDPLWGNYDDTVSNYSTIFGAEYELWIAAHQSLFKLTNAEKLYEHNIPCSVCKSHFRASVFMLPGRNVCYKGWNTEYNGYLMGGYHAYKSSSEYICVDEAPEADPAGYRNENGKMLLPVEGVCGSLPCPPYVAGRELTCAVCTK